MRRRGWTTAELAALHDELLTVAAATSRAIASGTAISISARAPHAPAPATLLNHLQKTATAAAVYWHSPAPPARFRSWPAIVDSFRALSNRRTRLFLPVAFPAALFGALPASNPFGMSFPRFLQIVLSLLVAAIILAWLWDAWLRYRIVRGPLDWWPRSQDDLIRILKMGLRLVLVLNLALAALVISASIPNLGLLVLIPWALIIIAAAIGTFPSASLAAADGRSAAGSRRLLMNDPFRYALGVLPTLVPCLLALFITILLVFNDAYPPAYNLAATIALAAFFAGALLHAEYLAAVYRHAAGLQP